jgi:hypothetical protein
MAEDNDTDYIFGLAGNAPLDVLVAEAADNRKHSASTAGRSGQAASLAVLCFQFQGRS